MHNLQDKNDHTSIVNDETFTKLFNTERMNLQQIPHLIVQYLAPPDPIVIEYTINMNEGTYMHTYMYTYYYIV